MKIFTGYRREVDGSISMIDIEDYNGDLIAIRSLSELKPTEKVVELKGWPDEGLAKVFVNDGGIEVLIPLSRIS